MFKDNIRRSLFYLIGISLITGWWSMAFIQNKSPLLVVENLSVKQPLNPSYHQLIQTLSPMKRETIHAALSGDISLMVKLISEWDLDAQIMEEYGIKQTRRLPREVYVRSQVLGRQFRDEERNKLDKMRAYSKLTHIRDDNDCVIDLTLPFSRFLPQTYVSASFLLSLLNPSQLVAIPKGMRQIQQIYSSELTKLIPLDIDGYNCEKLYQLKPQMAFVADYSHPATLQTLRNQGIQLFTLKNLNTLEDVTTALTRVGQVINRHLEAELLKIFMESSMLSIDNRLLALNLTLREEQKPLTFLFLNHYAQYSAPMPKTFTGQLLQQVKKHELMQPLYPKNSREGDWSVPMSLEQMAQLNPDCLIIATPNRNLLKGHGINDIQLYHLSAYQNQRVFYVDSAFQESPTQYIILAYYDIHKALVMACTE